MGIKLRNLYWPLSPNSKLSLENKLLINKTVVCRKGAFCDYRGNRRVSISLAGGASAFLACEKFMLCRQNFCIGRIVGSAEYLALTFEE